MPSSKCRQKNLYNFFLKSKLFKVLIFPVFLMILEILNKSNTSHIGQIETNFLHYLQTFVYFISIDQVTSLLNKQNI